MARTLDLLRIGAQSKAGQDHSRARIGCRCCWCRRWVPRTSPTTCVEAAAWWNTCWPPPGRVPGRLRQHLVRRARAGPRVLGGERGAARGAPGQRGPGRRAGPCGGWCLGGIFSLLTSADRPSLPVHTVTRDRQPIRRLGGAPGGSAAPARRDHGGRVISSIYQALGSVPAPVVKWASSCPPWDKYLTKPLTVLCPAWTTGTCWSRSKRWTT